MNNIRSPAPKVLFILQKNMKEGRTNGKIRLYV
nr:MAG TPA: hypothetical protein [Caudoviricetes sp.]